MQLTVKSHPFVSKDETDTVLNNNSRTEGWHRERGGAEERVGAAQGVMKAEGPASFSF